MDSLPDVGPDDGLTDVPSIDVVPDEVPKDAALITPDDSAAPVYVMDYTVPDSTESKASPEQEIADQQSQIDTAVAEIVRTLGLSETTARLMVTGQTQI